MKNNDVVFFILDRSGLEQDDMRIVFHYLVATLFPSTLERELHGSHHPQGATGSHYGKQVSQSTNVRKLEVHHLSASLGNDFVQLSEDKNELVGEDRTTNWLSHCRFVTGPPNMKNEDNLGKVPRVFLNTDSQSEACHLVVYKALSATVCLFIEGLFPRRTVSAW